MSAKTRNEAHNPWDDIYNFDDLCRLCGKRDTKMVSIFDNNGKHDFKVMINQHFRDFQVTDSDTLPKKICSKCKATVTLWHGFHQKCVVINDNFRNVLSKMTKSSTQTQSAETILPDETNKTNSPLNNTVGDDNSLAPIKDSTNEINSPSNNAVEDDHSFPPIEDRINETNLPLNNVIEEDDHSFPPIEVIEVKIDDDYVVDTFTISDDDDDVMAVENQPSVIDVQISSDESVVEPTNPIESSIEDESPDTSNTMPIIKNVSVETENTNVKSKSSLATTKLDSNAGMAQTVKQPSSSSSSKYTHVNKISLQSSNCRICGKSFHDRATYLRHLLKRHTDPSVFIKKPHAVGSSAATSTNGSPKVRRSLSRLHLMNRSRPPRKPDESNPVMCDLCGKTFVFRSSYHKHVREQHSEGPRIPKPKRARRMCDLCGKICSASSFKGHMKKHTNPEQLTCEYCNMVFSFDSVLRSHMKVKHSNERPFKCDECDAAFKRADYLRSHHRYKHQPKVSRCVKDKNGRLFYKCGTCESRFKNEELLAAHRTTNMVNGEMQCGLSFRCSECDATYRKRNYLLLHTRYVHGKNQKFSISEASIGPYKCDRCDRRFASVCGRNYHCKSVHGSIYNTKFNETCDHCGLAFRNRVFYAKHRAKIRDRPTCWMCWKEFDTDELLKEHIHQEHVDDLPFVCNECNCRFMAMRQLNEHVRSKHMKIRPFKCNYCDHAAMRKDSLEIHIRCCHLMIRPFKCDLCERAFAQASDLRKHRITHTRSLIRVKKPTKPKEESLKLEPINVTTLIELTPANFDLVE